MLPSESLDTVAVEKAPILDAVAVLDVSSSVIVPVVNVPTDTLTFT